MRRAAPGAMPISAGMSLARPSARMRWLRSALRRRADAEGRKPVPVRLGGCSHPLQGGICAAPACRDIGTGKVIAAGQDQGQRDRLSGIITAPVAPAHCASRSGIAGFRTLSRSRPRARSSNSAPFASRKVRVAGPNHARLLQPGEAREQGSWFPVTRPLLPTGRCPAKSPAWQAATGTGDVVGAGVAAAWRRRRRSGPRRHVGTGAEAAQAPRTAAPAATPAPAHRGRRRSSTDHAVGEHAPADLRPWPAAAGEYPCFARAGFGAQAPFEIVVVHRVVSSPSCRRRASRARLTWLRAEERRSPGSARSPRMAGRLGIEGRSPGAGARAMARPPPRPPSGPRGRRLTCGTGCAPTRSANRRARRRHRCRSMADRYRVRNVQASGRSMDWPSRAADHRRSSASCTASSASSGDRPRWRANPQSSAPRSAWGS